MAKPFTPVYRIFNLDTARDITAAIAPYLQSLSIEEGGDNKSDTLTLSVAGQGISNFPVSGTNIEVLIGYKETELVSFGAYKVDTKSLSGHPLVVTIKAGASDFNAQYKSEKTRHWDTVFLTDVLRDIALFNGLELSVDAEYEDIMLDYLSQTQESDMQLIYRLAREYSAEGTIKSDTLVFKVKCKAAAVIDIAPTDLSRFTINWYDKPRFDTISAIWRDTSSNVSRTEVYDGTGFSVEPFGLNHQVKNIFTSQFQTRKALKSQFTSLNAQQLSATLDMPGNPLIVSKLGLRLNGFIDDFNGEILYINQTRHTISARGYQTSTDCTNHAD